MFVLAEGKLTRSFQFSLVLKNIELSVVMFKFNLTDCSILLKLSN